MYDCKLHWTFLFLASADIGCVSTSTFASLVGIPIGITSFAVGWKIYAINVRIKKCKSIIQKKTW